MEKIEWDKSFEVGVSFIDEHHRELLKRFNAVTEAVNERQGEREITRTLKFLSDYADFHFNAEEDEMRSSGYLGLDEQLEEHRKFTDMLRTLEEDFRYEDATRTLSDSLNTFLHNWLINHIKGIDVKFGAYLKERKTDS